jgi:predicted lipoprotein with Yx(FWY)xxD motif/mono/diheme cytochrome c family protein
MRLVARSLPLITLVLYLGVGCAVPGQTPQPETIPGTSPTGAGPETQEPTTEELPPAAQGYQIFAGEGGCAACHTIEGLTTGMVGPDLSNIGNTAGNRQHLMTAREYLTESIRHPEAYVATQAERGVPGLMTREITAHLTDSQVEALVAFLLQQKRADSQELPAPTPFPPPDGQAIIEASEHPQLGPILSDSQGRSIYLYGGDGEDQSACFDECARVWPPVRTEGEPVAGDGVAPGLLDTIERDDGLSQVTYARWPLYYFVHDPEAAAASGHDIQDKWGLWLALTPSGEPAHSASPQPTD